MKITIYRKLVSGFVLVIGLMIATNIYVLWQLNEVTKTTDKTFHSDVRAITLAKQMVSALTEEERHTQKFLITRDSTYYTLYAGQSQAFARLLDSLRDTSPSPREVALIRRIDRAHGWATRTMSVERNSLLSSGAGAAVAGDAERVDTLDVLYASLNEIIRLNEDAVSNSVSGISKVTIRSSNVAWLITAGALLVALGVALVITSSIVKPIGTLIKGTENIARGIFNPIVVKSRDEMNLLARAVNDMSTKLKQINDLKTEMMHHISHELRTPLQTMLSAQYLLMEQKRGPLNADQMRLLTSIKDGIRKLTHFSNQFLDIQKIEHGSMEYRFDACDLLDILRPAVDDAQLMAGQKNVEVGLDVPQAPLPVMADKEKIAQVFSNLLSNAVKYTDAGGKIGVNVSRQKSAIRVSVSDTGAGIPPDDLPRIFTKFYQAKNSRKGTGIGLALVKALVEGHKGTVGVESELGKGTTFTIELPAAPQVDEDQRKPQTAETAA